LKDSNTKLLFYKKLWNVFAEKSVPIIWLGKLLLTPFGDFAGDSRKQTMETSLENPLMQKILSHYYLDPTLDAGFKVLFNNEKTLVNFLNSILHMPKAKEIKSLTFRNVEEVMLWPEQKTLRFDIRAETNEHCNINVEMQRVEHSFFYERVLLQGSQFMIRSKIEYDEERKKALGPNPTTEEKTQYNESRYDLPSVISIWICNFDLQAENYRDEWMLYSKESLQKGLPVTEKLKYLFVSLKAFDKEFESLRTDEDEWLYCLKHAGSSKGELPAMNNEVISESFRRLLVSLASSELLQEQLRSMEEEELREIVAASSYLKGKEEGKAEGILEIARRMLQKHSSIEDIAEVTGLSKEQIKAL